VTETAKTFIEESRAFLTQSFLPKIERCIDQLSDEDIWRRSNETSNSIGNLLLHLAGNVRQWIISGIGGEPDNRVRQQEFDERAIIPKAELISKLKGTVLEADRVLSEVNPEELLEKRKIRGNEVTMLYAIYHVVEHFSMHTGQIIFITKTSGERVSAL
jgi:uncharacterized damage-inducible protein DinB